MFTFKVSLYPDTHLLWKPKYNSKEPGRLMPPFFLSRSFLPEMTIFFKRSGQKADSMGWVGRFISIFICSSRFRLMEDSNILSCFKTRKEGLMTWILYSKVVLHLHFLKNDQISLCSWNTWLYIRGFDSRWRKKASSHVLQSHLPAFHESVSDYYIFRFTWGVNQWHKLINRKGLSLRKLSLCETFPKTGKYKPEKTPYLDISHQQTSFLKINEIQLDWMGDWQLFEKLEDRRNCL